MVKSNLDEEYEAFWDELVRNAEVSGDPQHESFFKLYAELAAENGDCADLNYCPIKREGSRPYQLDGYLFDPDNGELHLAVCDFHHDDDLQALNSDRINTIFNRARRFCNLAIDSEFLRNLEESSSEFELAYCINQNARSIKRIRCMMFSNARLATRKKTLEAEKLINAEMTFNIIDFQRFVDIQNSKDRIEPIELDIVELFGDVLPCLTAHFDQSNYESYLVVMPGSLLSRIYGLYGARLMEQNVRTFLQARTKANKGIITTANESPEMFFAYNNGITVTASSVEIEKGETGMDGIATIRDFQIVNGGQTTASLLYARDQNQADLSKISVQMKLSVVNPDKVDTIVPLISRYANTQNRVTEADFFSNHPFHVEMQKVSRRISTPTEDGALSAKCWFYERARGQYRNECVLRSSSERRTFEAKFPRSHVIQKTDLAKYQLTFACAPHVVSFGAQKCFLEYAKTVSQQWEKDKLQFNDDFFRDNIAKAIIFRWVDKHVGTSDWYKADRGYKANIVTYTIAYLVHYLEKRHSSAIDLELVWKRQSVPEELQNELARLAPRIANVIKNPLSTTSNISEYSKYQACWNNISSLNFGKDENLEFYSTSLGEVRQKDLDARSVKKLDEDIELDTLVIEFMEFIPQAILDANRHGFLTPNSRSALKKARIGNLNFSWSERTALKKLLKQLDEAGCGPSSWKK